jgi:thymidylate synthase
VTYTFSPFDVEDMRLQLGHELAMRNFVTDKSGVKTIEIVGASFTANERSIFGEVNTEWSQREVRWYLSESLNVNDIPMPIPEIWKQVADKDGFINSNYGWMLLSKENGGQFRRVVEELQRNPLSRRALAIYTRPSMWDDYNKNGRSDFCCTNAVQYLVRDGRVHAVVQMRSNDAVFGYKGDFYWQRYALSLVAAALSIDMGEITWQVGSLHVYERHFYMVDHFMRTGEHAIKKADYAAKYPDSEWK